MDSCPQLPGFQPRVKHPKEKNEHIVFCTIYAHVRMLVPNVSQGEILTVLNRESIKELRNLVVHYLGWQNNVL